MKPPRRSTRSKNSLFSPTEWKLDDKHRTIQSKPLGKAAKKTCSPDVPAKQSHGKTEGPDLDKREIRGASNKSNTEGNIISDGKSVGYPSSTCSHSINVRNCGNNKRNVINDKTQLTKLKKAGKNKTNIGVNSNMATYKKMTRQNEDSNIINSEDENMEQRQETGAFMGENGAVTEQTIVESIQDLFDNTAKASNAFLGPFTEVQVLKNNPELQLTPIISVKTEVETDGGEADLKSKAVDTASQASDMENSSQMILDMPSAIPSLGPHSTDDFSFQQRQNVTVHRPRPSVIMATPQDTISREGLHDLDTIGMDVPQHIIGMDHDYAKIPSHPRNVTGAGLASGRVDTPTRNLTTETAEAREDVSSEEGMQLGVAGEREHRAGLGESRQLGEAREMEHRAGLQVVGRFPRADEQVAGGGSSGSRSGRGNHVENNAQVAEAGAVGSRSEGVNAQVAEGAARGSQSEGENHSVENSTPAQVGNRGARVSCGACRGNDKIKIKMEIELSTDQFIHVAQVLPLLGSSANTE